MVGIYFFSTFAMVYYSNPYVPLVSGYFKTHISMVYLTILKIADVSSSMKTRGDSWKNFGSDFFLRILTFSLREAYTSDCLVTYTYPLCGNIFTTENYFTM